MVQFQAWCVTADSKVQTHDIRILSGEQSKLNSGIAATAAAVPSHYAAEERVASILQKLGKAEAAQFVEAKLPTSKRIRSGDLCEILATEFILDQSSYQVPIKRLRWKDHRNMSMRGDDVIAIRIDPGSNKLLFLKAEAKSRAALSGAVVVEARAGLDKDDGLPSAHALSFIADRLAEAHEDALSDAILDALLKSGIRPDRVRHLTFTFSGNDPKSHLSAALQSYSGDISQWSVGLRVDGHAAFVGAVYELVVANANS